MHCARHGRYDYHGLPGRRESYDRPEGPNCRRSDTGGCDTGPAGAARDEYVSAARLCCSLRLVEATPGLSRRRRRCRLSRARVLSQLGELVSRAEQIISGEQMRTSGRREQYRGYARQMKPQRISLRSTLSFGLPYQEPCEHVRPPAAHPQRVVGVIGGSTAGADPERSITRVLRDARGPDRRRRPSGRARRRH